MGVQSPSTLATVSIDGHTKGAPWYFEKSRLKLVVFMYR